MGVESRKYGEWGSICFGYRFRFVQEKITARDKLNALVLARLGNGLIALPAERRIVAIHVNGLDFSLADQFLDDLFSFTSEEKQSSAVALKLLLQIQQRFS